MLRKGIKSSKVFEHDYGPWAWLAKLCFASLISTCLKGGEARQRFCYALIANFNPLSCELLAQFWKGWFSHPLSQTWASHPRSSHVHVTPHELFVAMPNRLLERERFEIRMLNAEIRVARIEYMIAVLASGKCFFSRHWTYSCVSRCIFCFCCMLPGSENGTNLKLFRISMQIAPDC